jgi:hypothetical protein
MGLWQECLDYGQKCLVNGPVIQPLTIGNFDGPSSKASRQKVSKNSTSISSIVVDMTDAAMIFCIVTRMTQPIIKRARRIPFLGPRSGIRICVISQVLECDGFVSVSS